MRLNDISSLFANVTSKGLAKHRPKYNAKKDRNRLTIMIMSNTLMLVWAGPELLQVKQLLGSRSNTNIVPEINR